MHPMQSIVPAALIERGLVSQDEARVTWTCPICGVITPGRWGAGWFYRRLCPCQQRMEEDRRRKEDVARLTAISAEQQRALVYGWLGSDWQEPGLERLTFASFDRMLQPDAYDQAVTFARESCGTLLLSGDYGLGKTHLLAAIANARRERGEATLFASAVTLFDVIGDRIGRKQDYHDLLRRAIATPLFILDDVDKPKPSDFREEVYYQMIDGRQRRKLPLALSCNCPPLALARWIGGAARSRLLAHAIPMEMTGQDYRLLHTPRGDLCLGFAACETRFSDLSNAAPIPHAAHSGPHDDETNNDDPEEDDDA